MHNCEICFVYQKASQQIDNKHDEKQMEKKVKNEKLENEKKCCRIRIDKSYPAFRIVDWHTLSVLLQCSISNTLYSIFDI